ncbi:type II toxin-antitoxin system RelE/ParE family toxin [Eggerthella lenta]|uniref:type II toxin-antitoxin system RelE/ParE family toxin n=1 Tax=Eggerthella lenta TaxID=84112 RepID=UPI00215DB182|nr:type II toxin-antitoxin system RelE/ParE family toxin [Eggerthella lenta]
MRDQAGMMREPHSKFMGEGLLELRIRQGNDIARTFYFFFSGKKIAVTNGFVKKTRKTREASFNGLYGIRRIGKRGSAMDDLDRYHAKQMKDPEYAAEYERLQPEYDIIDAIIAARAEENLTQRELAQRCGMKQSAFARLESGNANPTLETLKRVAEGLGKQLRISFV